MMRRVKSVFGVMNPCRDEGRSLSVKKCKGQGFIAALFDNQRSSKRRDGRRRKIHFSRWKKKEGPTKIIRNIHPFVEVHLIWYTTTILHCHKSTKSEHSPYQTPEDVSFPNDAAVSYRRSPGSKSLWLGWGEAVRRRSSVGSAERRGSNPN